MTELGRFVAEQSGLEYRNVPLTDAEGRPAWEPLEGIETLRLHQLTSAPPDGEILQNYLVFAPDASECPEVASAPDPAGPYRPDRGAVGTGRTVTLRAMPGEARFYRVRARGAVAPAKRAARRPAGSVRGRGALTGPLCRLERGG